MSARRLIPALLALTAWSPSALACGGFFCNNTAPVDQSAERIAFAVNSAAGTVDAHVQIFYQGPSQDFAWVVPIPAEPELFLSTDTLFSQLDAVTRPRFNTTWQAEGDCGEQYYAESAMDDAVAGGADMDTGSDGGVTVVQRTQVGPYDAVVLQATSSSDLIAWLQDHQYDLPASLDAALAPYVAQNQYFLALRLLKDRDAGDIAPIGFRYAGGQASIPIQLTSVAATPDMRLEVYVFGEHRAVPQNYLHVQIDEAAIDWLGYGANYDQVVTLAADEAGGHAFATDFSGAASPFQGALWSPGRYDTSGVASATSPQEVMDALRNQGFPPSAALLATLESYMAPPQGVTAQDFYNCPSCYDQSSVVVEYAALAEALQTNIVAPLEAAEHLFADHSTVSRLTSSLSPAEMTVDPIFVQNPDMAAVSNVHDATVYFDCTHGDDWYTATRRLVLPDGREVLLPSQETLGGQGTSTADYMASVTDTHARVIEQTGASGQPQVVVDNSAVSDDQVQQNNDTVGGQRHGLFGCTTTGGGTGALALLLGVLVGLGRRRR